MKVGDLVRVYRHAAVVWGEGPIVGFNKKGSGGQDYVHVLIDGNVEVIIKINVEVINEGR